MPGPLPAPCMLNLGKATRSGSLSLEETVNDPDAKIKDSESARIFLDQLYMIQGELTTPEHISHALFYISQAKGVSNTLQSAIHATAYLVRDLATLEIAESITKAISERLETSIITAISPQVAKILSASENLAKINEDAEMLSSHITEKVESLTSAVNSTDPNQLESKVQDLIADVGTIKESLEDMKTFIVTENCVIPPTLYRDMLASTPPNPNQIPLGNNHHLLNSTTSRETIIDHIKQALESVDRIDGLDMQLKSITQLHNNSILIELNSQEAAVWIKAAPNKETFLARLGGKATIKD
ncbi:hypothetical protein M404DRAFT_30744 [Pisolithus tinctorius Marx 270]|uniref:Uncharacterized protein n=1 Tax=Pisolithus tinctorius Marx 270 TaxID=870435 RepID=A0A0C3NV77_PISTI|nr:hypothetical protein M404DRAFT_30744 [Pisolithus tinctorius Marx 270]